MKATAIRLMDGQMRQAGDQPLADAICDGIADGHSRAEMRELIDRQAMEIHDLKRRLEAANAAYRRETRARINADIECRVKTKALSELRRGHTGMWAQLLQLSSKAHQQQERFYTVVGAMLALGAITVICVSIVNLVN